MSLIGRDWLVIFRRPRQPDRQASTSLGVVTGRKPAPLLLENL